MPVLILTTENFLEIRVIARAWRYRVEVSPPFFLFFLFVLFYFSRRACSAIAFRKTI